MNKHHSIFTVRDLTDIGIMTATLEAGKIALSFLPNIELVSFFIIMYTLFFGRKVFYTIYTFVFIEFLLYGFGIWSVMYLYVWTILAMLVLLFHKQNHVLFFCTLSGFFGLCFGGLCSLPYIVISGPQAAFAWWIAGIPSDITHCISNFIICLMLYRPIRYVLTQLSHKHFT